MPRRSCRFIFPILLVAPVHLPALLMAQVAAPDTVWADDRVRVFLDCDRCDFDHIRREITFVNYVRDPSQADIHVFITDERTGLRGRQFQLTFLGQKAFESLDYTFDRTIDPNATNDEGRDAVTEAIRLGLVPYVVQTESLPLLALRYDDSADAVIEREPEDPWHHWIFTLYGGDFELELESNRVVFDSRWGFFADHQDEIWKLRVRPYFNYDFVKIRRDGHSDVRSAIRRHGLDTYAIRSVGPHWSLGLFGTYLTRNDRNLRHRAGLTPGVEYSVLPYDEATRRAVTFVYRLGLTYVDYYEQTIFNRTEEWLPRHELEANVAIRQPWGDIYGGLEGSQYFHDATKRRAEFSMYASVRIYEGLSLRVGGEFEMIQDQLSLPLGDASLEDILLEQRQLATDYALSGSIAVTYSFGSRFANIVNTRF